MSPVWRRELRRLVYLLILAVGCGYVFFDRPLEALCLMMGAYITWQWLQLYRLHRWLDQGQTTVLPRTLGIWGAIFTENQRLQQSNIKHQQRLQAIINRIQDSTAALQDSVLMVDASGALEFWNQAAQNYLGLRNPVDIGQPITNLIRTPEFKAYFDKADYQEPLTIRSPINPRIYLQFNITLFGRKDRLILIHDITRLKQLEEMRKDFVANVSHELRTPLTVIAGYVETMQAASEMLPPRWGRMLQQMSEQSHRMENLLKDLLMLSRLETGKTEQPQPIELQPLLEAIRRDAASLSSSKHTITLTIDQDQKMMGFYNELRSAFSNLVFNAVKYTPEGGDVTLRWYTEGGKGHFSVSDNGIGIAQHHIPRLTERFYRADPSRSIATGGTGLGLAIVKHVLLHHDGELKISSIEGKGSTFTCVFPAACLSDNRDEANQ
ncbi:phosphate regulon sensor histidine kinase PhoR [Oceanobacter sp. 3_MG-2023]|uniref:phosphate regulon sensor histidine kinase PhoR n=1 Tax=Oceanobacter sp. 3_MG-2023 TaxID=3062622 RepID=UPI002734BE97|nr:phosphate regulon sensor histidine kinase PhoR [Oceanobacter sp. 3_MG-2023]MDP2506884.1 phosphate regulon sensor histidine kinase PhoR [Oceanobacter sp. 3_MG-2023]